MISDKDLRPSSYFSRAVLHRIKTIYSIDSDDAENSIKQIAHTK